MRRIAAGKPNWSSSSICTHLGHLTCWDMWIGWWSDLGPVPAGGDALPYDESGPTQMSEHPSPVAGSGTSYILENCTKTVCFLHANAPPNTTSIVQSSLHTNMS